MNKFAVKKKKRKFQDDGSHFRPISQATFHSLCYYVYNVYVHAYVKIKIKDPISNEVFCVILFLYYEFLFL